MNKVTKVDEDDPIVKEIPVFLAKGLAGNLHLFQYPVNSTLNGEDGQILKAKIKPECGLVEVELELPANPVVDYERAEEIANKVDGPRRNDMASSDKYFPSHQMDKLKLTGTKSTTDVNRYCIGVMAEDGLHLTPLSSIIKLTPSFDYLDKADNQSKKDMGPEEKKAQKITVRFEKPETERSKMYKEKSYSYFQKKINEEEWIPLACHKQGSMRSNLEFQKFYCTEPETKIRSFTLDAREYLGQLLDGPGKEGSKASKISDLDNTLEEAVSTLLVTAGYISFKELTEALTLSRGTEDTASILKAVQQVAVLVQGNWVVKSDLLFIKDGVSETKVPNEDLQKVRDYVLYLLSKSTSLKLSDVVNFMDIPMSDIREILQGVAQFHAGLWHFKLPTDTDFIHRHAEVYQRQQMIWQAKHEQVSHTLKEQSTYRDKKSHSACR